MVSTISPFSISALLPDTGVMTLTHLDLFGSLSHHEHGLRLAVLQPLASRMLRALESALTTLDYKIVTSKACKNSSKKTLRALQAKHQLLVQHAKQTLPDVPHTQKDSHILFTVDAYARDAPHEHKRGKVQPEPGRLSVDAVFWQPLLHTLDDALRHELERSPLTLMPQPSTSWLTFTHHPSTYARVLIANGTSRPAMPETIAQPEILWAIPTKEQSSVIQEITTRLTQLGIQKIQDRSTAKKLGRCLFTLSADTAPNDHKLRLSPHGCLNHQTEPDPHPHNNLIGFDQSAYTFWKLQGVNITTQQDGDFPLPFWQGVLNALGIPHVLLPHL